MATMADKPDQQTTPAEIETWMARDPSGQLHIHHSGDDPDAVKAGVAWVHDDNGGTRQAYDGFAGRWASCEAAGWRLERVAVRALT